MEDIDSMMIGRSKFMADGDKYFKLFEKYVPVGIGGNVLLMTIGNVDCLAKLMSLNKKAKYTIVENTRIIKCLDALFNGELSIKPIASDDLDLYNIIKGLDMKFDCIIMNPPYQKNLHLKVLAEAIKHLKDDGVCVNLSPVRWLQDPLAKYKKNSDYHRFQKSISEKLTDVVVIPKLEAQNYFPSTVMGADLAIYVARNIGGFDIDSLVNPIFKKVLKKQTTHPVFDEKQKDGFRVRIAIIVCNGGSGNNRKTTMATLGRMLWFENGMRDGKPWYEAFGRNQHTKTTPEIPYSIKFDSKIEAENFCRQFDTIFCKVYTHLIKSDVHVTPEIVLWMGDAVNPRTGLKGYLSEWTDEDFYRYFELTDDEIKIVKDTMKKYAAK